MRLFGWALEYYDTVTEVEDDFARRARTRSRAFTARASASRIRRGASL